MFRLTDDLEETIELYGEKLTLDMSFNNVLIAIDVLNDDELFDQDKLDTFLYLMTGAELNDLEEEERVQVVRTIVELFSSEAKNEQELDLEGNPMPIVPEEETYSLSQDAEYIFASFLQAYGVDLIEEQGKLHWRKFKALLTGLPQDTIFKEIIQIRTADLPKAKGGRKQMLKAKKQYELK